MPCGLLRPYCAGYSTTAAMTIVLLNIKVSSCPAQAGHPVFRGVSIQHSGCGLLDRPPARAKTIALLFDAAEPMRSAQRHDQAPGRDHHPMAVLVLDLL